MNLDSLLKPHSVAVVGSASEGKLANILIHRLYDGGMETIYAVNPKGQGVGPVPGFKSVREIGKPIDLAVIAAPAATVPDVLEDCGKSGIKAAVIISSGFSEVGNHAGEKAVEETAKKYGIHFVGPNCAGIVNTHVNLIATIETVPSKGSISIISQSGAIGGAFMSIAAEQKLGIAKFLSFGNGCDLNVIDFLNYLKDDDETKVIALYLESVKDGRSLMAALRDVTRKKPVVIVKSGRTSTGQRAAMSHTGSMAGSDAIFDAALRQCGAIRADTLEDLFHLCKGFSMLPAVKGNRLLIVTNSGGPGVMTTDRAERAGLNVAEPDEALRGKLKTFLKDFAGVKNPIDLTVEGTGEQYRQSLVTALEQYDCAAVIYVGTPYLKAMPVAQGIAQAAKESGKPVSGVLMVGSDIEESRKFLNDSGVPVYSQGEIAAEVLSKMCGYEKKRIKAGSLPEAPQPESSEKISGTLLEPDSMKLLKGSGISVPKNRFVQSRGDIAAACGKIGFPVVMKVVSPQIIHKSDVGGVILHIKSVKEAEDAFDRLEKVAENKDFKGVMVYPMLQAGKEVILGLTRDAQFGPVVAFGLGGIYTEVLKDVVFRVAPVDKQSALEMIGSIRSFAILKGLRGQAPVDLDALAETIVSFSRLPFSHPEISEADLNPVFVYEKGIVTADVRIICK